MPKRPLAPNDRSVKRRCQSISSSSSQSSDSSSSLPKKKLSYKDLKEKRDQLLSEKFGYTNESNPFGDSALSQPFIWKKKAQLLEAAGRKNAIATRPEQFLLQTERKLDEIDRVRKRRQQHELEEKLLEEQQAQLAREREQEHYGEWQAREEAFHREASRQRTNIRLKQGRERPGDLLVKALRMADGERFADLTLLQHSADVFVQMISIEDLKDLLTEAEQQHEICRAAAETPEDEYNEQMKSISWARGLELKPTEEFGDKLYNEAPPKEALARHQVFWSALLLVGTDALERKLKQEQQERQPLAADGGRDMTSGIALPVLKDLDKILQTKTKDELNLIEKQVEKKLKSIRSDASSHEDFTYWETIQEKLPYFKAVAELHRVHRAATEAAAAISRVAASSVRSAARTPEVTEKVEKQQQPAAAAVYCDLAQSLFWPPLVLEKTFKQAADALLNPQEFEESRKALRLKLVEQRREKFRLEIIEKEAKEKLLTSEPGSEIYEKFVREESMALGVDEFVMTPAYEMAVKAGSSSSSSLGASASAHHWDERHRPRKPRFFNRVKTGYEWTKYNQSHFDRDNPPPKAVQGYKFTLFYPDLIDKAKAPKWKLGPSDTPDTVHIRFSAGPPYEDVMFKIVNREWDINTRKGFRNTFDRGILQLHFNFKRFRYRK